jgi:hypothetical protein
MSRQSMKRFKISLEVEGSMLDEDTPISEQSLVDLLQLQYSDGRVFKIVRIDAQEILDK